MRKLIGSLLFIGAFVGASMLAVSPVMADATPAPKATPKKMEHKKPMHKKVAGKKAEGTPKATPAPSK